MVRFRKRKKVDEWKKIISLSPGEETIEPFSSNLSENEQILKEMFQNCADFIIRPIYITGKPKIILAYLDGLTDTKTLENMLFKPMVFEGLPNDSVEIRSIVQIMEKQL